MTDEWQTYVNEQKRHEFEAIVKSENLKPTESKEFITTSFRRGYVPEVGLELNGILPPINPFDPKANREGVMQRVLEKIKQFFNKFYDVANGEF